MTLRSAHATHAGLVRENNEDAYLDTPGLYAVADGMGGHAAGEVASQLATDMLRVNGTMLWNGFDPTVFLRCSFGAAHADISINASTYPARAGMGTTLTALAIRDGIATIAHVGDSRCYLVRDGIGKQLTTDQAGPRGLTNCLGSRADAFKGAEVHTLPVRSGDVFVLCSDGLGDYADAAAVGCMVENTRALGVEGMAHRLVNYALESGGHDNVTVVVVEVG